MKLGKEIGLGPGHIALAGDPAPPLQKGAHPPNFRSMVVMHSSSPLFGPYVVAKRSPSYLLLSTCLLSSIVTMSLSHTVSEILGLSVISQN